MATDANPRKKRKTNETIFNDPVHGTIEMPPLCVLIIDTQQFQRLRRIKQLGSVYHVYPGAAHNRFEHSIGVGYLAWTMVKQLQLRQPELEISPIEKLCVTIAGICHDLGHGPFSHTFDQQFLPQTDPNTTWTHEKASIDMFDHLIAVNNLRPKFIEHGFREETFDTDLIFIKELIYGVLPGNKELKGRPNKQYLYERGSLETRLPLSTLEPIQIISNKRTSVDVDKWDYFARDCLMVGMKSDFDHMRCMKFSRVIKDKKSGEMLLCLRDKELDNIYEMFHIRNNIHRRICKHAVTLAVDMMHVDALVLAEESNVIKIPGENGHQYNISECKEDMEAFTQLTDNIFHQILFSTEENEELKKARELLERVENRQLYKCVGQAVLPKDFVKNKITEIKRNDGNGINKYAVIKELEKEIFKELKEKDDSLSADKITMKFVDFDYSMKDKNPADNMRLFSKAKPNETKQIKQNEVSLLLPTIFEEHMISLYYKDKDMSSEDIKQAQDVFEKWGEEHNCTMKIDRWR